MTAYHALLPNGRRHFQHGPIDIVIGADGEAKAVQSAHASAWQRFEGVLEELVAELRVLRLPIVGPCPLRGPIARRMWHACRPHRGPDSAGFITPMAAVAGAVAEELIAHYRIDGIERAWVNNGGDIAWHLAAGRSLRVGLFADLARLDAQQLIDGIRSDGQLVVTHDMPARGMATSGWRGRSFSRGIADSVTVLAHSAAEADAAATAIANAVDIDDPRIERRPANQLKDDSDLGDIAVTVGVPRLNGDAVRRALDAGRQRAEALRGAGSIEACTLVCQGQVATVGEHDGPASAIALA